MVLMALLVYIYNNYELKIFQIEINKKHFIAKLLVNVAIWEF